MKQGIAITRGQLAIKRREAADRVRDQDDEAGLAELVRLHFAIEALDAVGRERSGNASSPWDDAKFKLGG